MNSRLVQIDYTNHRGERAWRTIHPTGLTFGTQWHANEWVIVAWDVEKQKTRSFALSGIHQCKPVEAV